MAPVPIYSQSPINAAKASGVTPQTAQAGNEGNTVQPAITTAPPSTTQQVYSQAQPGAVPSLPIQTAAAPSQRYMPVQPTPTRNLDDQTPPAPQPGAVPIPPGSRNPVPPPPKAGERYSHPEQTPAPQPANIPYPAQMSVPAPAVPFSQRGTAAAGPPAGSIGGQPTGVLSAGGPSPAAHFQHPPGYQQDVNASEFSSNKRAAHHASLSVDAGSGSAALDDGEEGVWDSAKKLVQAAGDKLSAAESEVWRRINKG